MKGYRDIPQPHACGLRYSHPLLLTLTLARWRDGDQEYVGHCGVGETEAEPQSITQILQPLKEVISKIPTVRLNSSQQALLSSSLATITDMSSLDTVKSGH